MRDGAFHGLKTASRLANLSWNRGFLARWLGYVIFLEFPIDAPGSRTGVRAVAGHRVAFRLVKTDAVARNTPVTRLSIVIPCLTGADQFETALASVLQNRPAHAEIIVLQPRAYDDPYDLASEVRFVEVPGARDAIDLINRGLHVAKGDIFHLLACDTEVVEGWAEGALACFRDGDVGCVIPTLVQCGGIDRVEVRGLAFDGTRISCVAGRKPVVTNDGTQIIGPTLNAGFYRRRALLELGGFEAAVGTECIGLDAAMELESMGLRTVHADGCVVFSGAKPAKSKWSRQSGRRAEHLYWRQMSAGPGVRTLSTHVGAVTRELAGHFYNPRLWLHFWGRIQAGIELAMFMRPITRRDNASGPRRSRCAPMLPATLAAPRTARSAAKSSRRRAA